MHERGYALSAVAEETPDMTVRILIADDQALVRAGFKMILDAEDDLDVVGEASDGAQAVAMANDLKPDVVLMDIRMPELDGIEATRRIIAAAGERPVRVLMLTTFESTSTSTRPCGPGPAASCSRTCRPSSSWPASASWPRARRCWRPRSRGA
jgi:DNA-binding NarL/FixJ family response regulator